jgi:hypothetical protein
LVRRWRRPEHELKSPQALLECGICEIEGQLQNVRRAADGVAQIFVNPISLPREASPAQVVGIGAIEEDL